MEHTRWIVPDSLWQKLLATIQRAIQTLKQSRFREKAIAKGRNVTNHFTESQAPRILRNRITQWAKSEAYLFFVGTMALNQTT
jgi:hypothetical protein